VRIAIFSDVHANLVALDAVMADWQSRVDLVWCLGDIVGYGPEPNACVELVRAVAPVCVAGNHDWAAVGRIDTEDFNELAATAAEWTGRQLTTDAINYLENLPLRHQAGEFGLAHGSPRDPIWEYVLSDEIAAANLLEYPGATWFVGHSHVAGSYSLGETASGTLAIRTEPVFYDRWLPLGDRRHLINVGSVGQPRDADPASRYVILDVEGQAYQRRRVSYDIARTQARMRSVGLPEPLVRRLAVGR
jgi:predicted phosphodiesterase